MAAVKGSKIKRIKIIQYSLRNVLGVVFLLLILVGASVAGSYFYGHKIGMAGQEKALQDVEHYKSEMSTAQAELARVEQSLANVQLSSEVDRQSNEEVRQEVIGLKDEIARLEEENNFYRGLMAPTENATGLTIGSVELIAGNQPRTYAFKVVVQQLATRHNLLSGHLNFVVKGRWNGLEHEFALKDISEQISDTNVRLRFKYFQVIDGELSLPEGFEPEGIEIVAKVTGNKPQSQTKKFGWLVQES